MAEPVDVFRFSTQAWGEKDRIEGWREAFGRGIMRTEIDPVGDATFRAEMMLKQLPGLGVAQGHSSGAELRRTIPLIDNDDVVLSVVLDGVIQLQQRGRDVLVRAGEAALTTSGEVGVGLIRTGAQMTMLRLPRLALEPLVKDVDAAIIQRIPADRYALQLLVGYSDVVLSVPTTGDARASTAVAAHMRDLVALALGANRDGEQQARSRGVRAARLAAIEADLDANFAQPHLTVAILARRNGLSVRYVQALLTEQETSFSEALLERRLMRALQLLSARRTAKLPIAAVALEVGFNDLSYFHRAFRRRYGMSPGDARAIGMPDD